MLVWQVIYQLSYQVAILYSFCVNNPFSHHQGMTLHCSVIAGE